MNVRRLSTAALALPQDYVKVSNACGKRVGQRSVIVRTGPHCIYLPAMAKPHL